MPTDESVPRSSWQDALESLTREHQADVVTIEVTTQERRPIRSRKNSPLPTSNMTLTTML
jgi:hypothetical protein